MAIPKFQQCLRPLLEVISDGRDYSMKVVRDAVCHRLNVSDEERAVLLPSGGQTVMSNRVAWAKAYLTQAGLVQSPSRGIVRITPEGSTVLANGPPELDLKFLLQYESVQRFRSGRNPSMASVEVKSSDSTPEELIEQSYRELQDALANELLDKVKTVSPMFFEQLVIDLLLKMGYGGSREDAAQAIGGPRDGGIDGIINEDRLGLDIVCIQAKRWEGTVGRPIVQAFAGSMEGHRARKGVLITTSSFSQDAEDYVTRTERKIVLIDGRKLAELMIEHDVGVAIHRSLEIKKIDQDYFDPEGL